MKFMYTPILFHSNDVCDLGEGGVQCVCAMHNDYDDVVYVCMDITHLICGLG